MDNWWSTKKNDKIILIKFKKKIIKAYIVGRHKNFFHKTNLNNKVQYEITKNLKVAVDRIFKSFEKKKKVYLFI